MKQIATVVRIVDENTAEVIAARQSACGHDCENCSGCGSQGTGLTVRAVGDIPVAPGDKVEIFTDNRVLGYAALVYLLPIVLFLAGYLVFPSLSETIRYLCGGAGFAVGIGAAVLCDRLVRRRGAVSYQIIRKM